MWSFTQWLNRVRWGLKSGDGPKKTSVRRQVAQPASTRFRPNLEELESRIVPSFVDGGGAVITNIVEQNNWPQLLISFDGSLNATPANSAANYSVQVPGTNPEVVTTSLSTVSITSATYNSTLNQVTLNLATPLIQGTSYRVFVNGNGSADAGNPGLVDLKGNAIDGDYDDTPSGNFYALFVWSTTSTTPTPTFTDSSGYSYTMSLTGPGQLNTWRVPSTGTLTRPISPCRSVSRAGAIQQITVANGVLGLTTLDATPSANATETVVVVPSIAGQGHHLH